MQTEIDHLFKKETKKSIVIGSSQPIVDYIRDCYLYKDLFLFLSLRDVQVKYKQAFFGIAWALVRPILNMVLFALVFGRLASLPSHNVSYALFGLAGILPWQLFINFMSEGATSLVNNANLITKLYFPRVLIPLAGLLVNLIDFGVGMIFLTALMLVTGDGQLWSFMLVTPFIVLTLCFSVGATLWFSAMTVKFRDFRFIIPLLIQLGMFISPVAYDSDLINPNWFWLYALNPLVGIICGFRFAFFGIVANGLAYSVLTATIVSMTLLVTGLIFFRSLEKHFADQI